MTVIQDNIRVSMDIFALVQNELAGEVLLTTSKGIYLKFPTRILLLTEDKFGIIPIGLAMHRFVDFVTLVAPKEGQPVIIKNSTIQFPGGILLVQWVTEEPMIHLATPLDYQIRLCAESLVGKCNIRSVAKLASPLLLGRDYFEANTLCNCSRPNLQLLLDGIRENSASDIDTAVGHLLGLGFGLTPSLDDVLNGLLYGLYRLAPQKASTVFLAEAILKLSPSRTNEISSAYLNAIAQGGTFSLLDQILMDLCADVPLDISSILQIGSSSGSEMLFGLLLAAQISLKG